MSQSAQTESDAASRPASASSALLYNAVRQLDVWGGDVPRISLTWHISVSYYLAELLLFFFLFFFIVACLYSLLTQNQNPDPAGGSRARVRLYSECRQTTFCFSKCDLEKQTVIRSGLCVHTSPACLHWLLWQRCRPRLSSVTQMLLKFE